MENVVGGGKRHFVLVHGSCHGAWCWYKLATVLAAAGHRVSSPDLAACGADARRLQEVETFSDYSQPLLDVMAALPQGERVVMVAHSFGGLSAALAMEKFPEKVAAAVFVSALLPDATSRPSYVLDEFVKKFPMPWMDTQLFSLDTGSSKPLATFLLGPKMSSSRLYQLCSPEDITLAMSLIRVSSYYLEDLSRQPPLSEQRYGSVKRIYIVCEEDLGIPKEFQVWMTENYAVDDVKLLEGADHMAMLSKPRELCKKLLDVANMYA